VQAASVFAADPPEPVLYFSFDEDGGDEVEDMSGNENHGTIPINGKSVEGKFGNGLELGLPDTVDVQHSDSLIFNDELTVLIEEGIGKAAVEPNLKVTTTWAAIRSR